MEQSLECRRVKRKRVGASDSVCMDGGCLIAKIPGLCQGWRRCWFGENSNLRYLPGLMGLWLL